MGEGKRVNAVILLLEAGLNWVAVKELKFAEAVQRRAFRSL